MPQQSLLATGDGSFADISDQDGNTTDLFDSVDDDPASPSDVDYITNVSGGGGGFLVDELVTETV